MEVSKRNLIFDIGFHKCEDIDFYLLQGYDVVGIDADISNVNRAREEYVDYIKSGQLILEHCAITKPNEHVVDFYRCEHSIWSSLDIKIASRCGLFYEIDRVKGMPLSYFLKKYGVPYYCKIDIEGYDTIALQSIGEWYSLPDYISVETECLGEREVLNETQILSTLVHLHRLGYQRFKLIDQETFKELLPGIKFFGTNLYGMERRRILSEKLNYLFPVGSTGPFGELWGAEWLSYEEAIETILFHRTDFFQSYRNVENFAFCCDWHAAR